MNIDKQNKLDKVYMKMTETWSTLSYAKRLKVGALIVKDGAIISDGYNGTPSGFENECEEPVYSEDNTLIKYQTKWYVLHAEANAILKLARSTQNSEGSTLYLTYSPCPECSKLIFQSGIKRVVYKNEFRNTTGLDFLRKAGVELKKIDMDD